MNFNEIILLGAIFIVFIGCTIILVRHFILREPYAPDEDLSNIKGTPFSNWLMALIVIAGLLTNVFGSGYLNELRAGNKIDPEEAEFSVKLADIIPKRSRVLFISEGNAKMAEISGAIPYNPYSGYYVPYTYGNPFWISDKNLMAQADAIAENHKAILGGCVECLDGLDVNYIVLNTNQANIKIPGKEIYRSKGFILYER